MVETEELPSSESESGDLLQERSHISPVRQHSNTPLNTDIENIPLQSTEDTNFTPDSHNSRRCCTIQRRYVVVFLLFLVLCASNAIRVIINIAIVAMTTGHLKKHTQLNSTETAKSSAEFDWDGTTEGYVLGSYFYGYIMLQIPAGYFSSRFGARFIMTVGLVGSGLSTILNPIAAKLSPVLLAALRVLHGLLSCLIMPAVYTILSKWSPPNERSKLATLALSGVTGGVVVGNFVSGVLSEHMGWRSAFYIQGGGSLLVGVLYFALTAESPDKDRWISKEELHYIKLCFSKYSGTGVQKAKKVPWKRLLTSVPVLALVVTHTCHNWGFYTLLVEMPSYLSKVHDFDVQKSGIISALPYLLFLLVGIASGNIVDRIRRSYLSTTVTRKICNTLGLGAQAVFLVIVSIKGTSDVASIGYVLAVGLGGMAMACFPVNHLDISPRYSGLLFGLSNTIATIPGAVSPLVVGAVTNKHTHEEWRIVFLIACGAYVLGVLVFLLFGSAEKQSWDSYGLEESEGSHEKQDII